MTDLETLEKLREEKKQKQEESFHEFLQFITKMRVRRYLWKERLYDMIAKYNNNYYIYFDNMLITYDKSKTDDNWIPEYEAAILKVNESDLQEIFNISFFVYYDSKILGIQNEWFVPISSNRVTKDTVTIDYLNGVLDGWDYNNTNECQKTIRFDEDIIGIKEVITYSYRNNKKDSTIDTRFIDRDTFLKEYNAFYKLTKREEIKI